MSSILKWLSLTFAAMILGLALFVSMPYSLSTTLHAAKKILPGTLKYKTASGALAGTMNITGLHYRSHGLRLTIKEFKLQWHPWSLLLGKINLETLKINHICITQPQSPSQDTEENETSALLPLHLPLALHIGSMKIHDFRMGDTPRHYTTNINTLQAKGVLSNEKLNFILQAKIKKPTNVNVNISLNGKITGYTLDTTIHSPDSHAEFIGKGSDKAFSLSTRSGKLFGGTTSLALDLKFLPLLQWKGKIQMNQIALSELIPGWPKPLTVTLDSQGQFSPETKSLESRIQLKTPLSIATIHIHHKNNWKITWDIALHQIQHLLPKSHGDLLATGLYATQGDQFSSRGQATATAFILPGLRLKSLQANWDLLQPTQHSQINIQGQRLLFGDFHIKNFLVAERGGTKQLSFSTQLESNRVSTFLKLTGTHHKGTWRFALNTWKTQIPELHQWQLKKAPHFTWNDGTFRGDPICIASDAKESICLNGKLDDSKNWELSFKGDNIKLDNILKQMENDILSTAVFDFSGKIQGDDALHTMDFNLNVHPGQFKYHYYTQKPQTIKFQGGKTHITLHDNKLQSKINFKFDNDNYIATRFDVSDVDEPDSEPVSEALDGKIEIAFKDIRNLNGWAPEYLLEKGTLNVDINATGTVKQPELNGHVKLAQTAIKMYDLGLVFTPINLNIALSKARLKYDGEITSKGRPITLSGQTTLKSPYFPTQISVKGENVLVMNSLQYIVHISPDLKISKLGSRVFIDGSLTIPQAEIKPHNFKSVTTLPQNQIVYIGKPDAAIAPAETHVYPNVTLLIGDKVLLKAYGLRAKLTGKLHLHRKKRQPLLADGEILIAKGEYQALGHQLHIKPNSTLEYDGAPLSSPTINLRAYRILRTSGSGSGHGAYSELEAGLHLVGSIKNPTVKLYSVPANLTQGDILSYIMTGRPASASGPDEASALLQAGALLNMGGGSNSGFLGQLRHKLGFNEFGFESEPTLDSTGGVVGEERYFVVGKQIKKSLYLRYKSGMSSPINTFQLRYDIDDIWSIYSNISTLGSGADLIYTKRFK